MAVAHTRDMRPVVLVIDDEPSILGSLSLVLELHGFEVVTAKDGAVGLKTFRETAPAVVLIDIIMPERDGIETIIRMRRERPESVIVAMSGGGRLGNTQYLDVAAKLGADAVLEKPFDPEALVDLLNTTLKRDG